MYKLAVIYKEGKVKFGIKKDLKKAILFYQKSAYLNDHFSQNKLFHKF
jgi:TPR repeat protein